MMTSMMKWSSRACFENAATLKAIHRSRQDPAIGSSCPKYFTAVLSDKMMAEDPAKPSADRP